MKKESKYTQYIEWGLMIVLFFGIIKFLTEFGFTENLKPNKDTGIFFIIIGIVFIAFVVLAIHELGHLITGLVNGFRFDLFVVGPLGIKRENDKIKIYLNKNLAHYGGLAATSPTDDHPDNAKKFARILLAGPIASVLFSIVCFAISYHIGKPLGIIFYTGGFISIMIFLVTTIPSKTGMFFTDRKRYQRLVTPGKDQQVELAMLNIIGRFSKDHSYKNVSPEDINILVSDDLPFVKFMGLFNLVCYQLENDGEIAAEASEAYEDISKDMSPALVNAFNKEIEKFKEKLLAESK